MEKHLAARIQQLINVPQKPCTVTSIQEIHSDDKVKPSTLQASGQRGNGEKRDLRRQIGSLHLPGRECSGSDRIFASRDPHELSGKNTLAAAQLKNGLPREEMHHVTEC